MPLRRHRLPSLITRLVLLSLAAVCLAVLRPAGRANARVRDARRRRPGLRRAAVSLSFATLFFAGAAFSAGAGDLLVQAVEDQHAAATASPAADDSAATDSTCDEVRRGDWDAEDSSCPEAPPAESEPAAAPASEPAAEAPAQAVEAAPESAPETASPETASPSTTAAIAAAAGNVASQRGSSSPSRQASPTLSGAVRTRARRAGALRRDPAPPVIEAQSEDRVHRHETLPDPEVHLPGMAPTIWLHRALPDPTPPSKRLTKQFARNLRYSSARAGVHWSLVLGVLRARGERGSVPATKRGLNRLARNLARLGARKDEWNAALALEGRTAFADRTVALARYHRAVGLRALVRGLRWARPMLAKKLLNDRRVTIYPGGREDIRSGKTDVRVIVLIRYLAEAHGQVTISSLTSGHRFFSRPGVVSAHSYGQAVDIAALEGKSIAGNQEPGGLTEMAVRNLLLLPAELRPNQLISLLGLGGPSFPMANHDDHIHAGF
ncbi:MAG TPA: hypothetical protein VFL41_05185 [Gaiellaceae bacterium]|nr:hypothetical protein [Gaiellaceae bacterium]